MQRELNNLITKLRRLEGEVTKNIKGDLTEAGKVVVAAIRQAAPLGKRVHRRYSSGKVVATYQPGNLRRSIRKLPLRRTKNAVIIGPLSRGGRDDGYYAHMVEFGTVKMTAQPFIEAAADRSLPIAQQIAERLLKRRIDSYAQKIEIP